MLEKKLKETEESLRAAERAERKQRVAMEKMESKVWTRALPSSRVYLELILYLYICNSLPTRYTNKPGYLYLLTNRGKNAISHKICIGLFSFFLLAPKDTLLS